MSQFLYQARARRWEESGHSAELLVSNPYELMALRCWVGSSGAKEGEVSDSVKALAAASIKAKDAESPSWYEQLLAERSYCDRCGETYRVENLSICTKCLGTYCFSCGHEGWRGGMNPVHFCGGEIVG